ncbi:MAG: DUF4115 domain-containing protein [Firmicutes bacterium]|nr:DUF4115 domain-containing protein [Bacillota bacterium]
MPMAELGRLAGRGGARRGGAGAGGPRRAARERPAAGERAADAGRAQVPARAAGARADDTFESGEPGDAGGGEPAAREAPGPSRRAARGAGRGARLGGPEPLRRRRSPATGLLLAAAFLAGAGWWIWRTETAAPGGAFTPSGATAPSEPSGTPGASGGESEPAAGGAPASETAPSETAPQVTVERSLDPDGTIVYTVRHAQGLDVSVTFTGPCWVRALADGREVEAGATYQSGDAAHWTAQQELRLTLGYAEHAQIAVDGLDQGVVAGGARVKTVRIVLAGE